MSKDKRDAERAARRAKRLAERAEERARRKEEHADDASERADRLAERVNRRPQRDRDLDKSIEDLVDDMTDKAEQWVNEKTGKLFDSPKQEREVKRAEAKAQRAKQAAEKARETATRAEQAAEDLSHVEQSFDEDFDELYDDVDDLDLSPRARRKAGRTARKKARQRKYGHGRSWYGFDWGYDELYSASRSRAKRRRSAHFYRDKQREKVCGVCAGLADYFGRPTWEIRLYAVLGLVFIPSVTVPAYFITYWLMDDKPYYRRVTDRFEETVDTRDQRPDDESKRSVKRESRNEMNQQASAKPKMNNVQAMKKAREKFADIELRLRGMETHVTSSRFELQRELKKISGED